jgi:hypothetical protein
VSAANAELVDANTLSTEDVVAVLYEGGNLRHKLQAHQLESYDAFRAWNVERQSREYIRQMAETGALYDNMWIDEWGRRGGKTSKWIITAEEEMLRRPGCRGMIATPLQKSIGGIIVPLTKILFADAPPEYFPKYVGSKDADHQGLYVEATDSFCKLVGLDKHPDATRGQFLDFCIVTEAAFVKGLYELVTAVLMPQFRYRPWAWFAGESSTAKAPDCDFNREFREDAKLRGTYRKLTIRDNKQLTDDEIAQEERRSGGKSSPNCRRELYCEEVRDVDEMVVPEFEEAVHVVDPRTWPRPRHALAHVGLDPGVTDPFGLVWIFFDWSRQCIVVEGAWQRPNASTGEVVSVTHAMERELWGSSHRAAGEKRRELSIADALTVGSGKVWESPDDSITYWEGGEWTLKPNPYSRISDIANRFILDMNKDYGMNVRPAEKSPGSKEADTEYLRTLFSARPVRIVILRNGKTEPLIQQLRSGMWNTDENNHRTDWQRSKTLGHLDCLAALKYVVRDVNWQRNPNPPAHVDPTAPDYYVPDDIRKQAKHYQQTPDSFGGRGHHSFGRSRRESYR